MIAAALLVLAEISARLRTEPAEAETGQPVLWILEVEHPAGASVRLPDIGSVADDSWIVLEPRPSVRTSAAGVIGLQEIETRGMLELDTRSTRVRQAWRAEADRRRADLHAGLNRARVERIELDPTRDLGEPILAFFRRRALRHGAAR